MNLTPISNLASCYLKSNLDSLTTVDRANALLKNSCGVNDFFRGEADLAALKKRLNNNSEETIVNHRRQFGDYQTGKKLAKDCVNLVKKYDRGFELLIEPTCGRGNFILAALKTIKTLKKIIGIEIHEPYVWETKLRILNFYLKNKRRSVITIDIIQADVFHYDFHTLSESTRQLKLLLIGNPPWITNAELGTLNSNNLPIKNSRKLSSGLDALTGKSNFDLGEAILVKLIEFFQAHRGSIAFLIKSLVIKNLVKNQARTNYLLGEHKKFVIDAKKEFDVNVNAALYIGRLNSDPAYICTEYDFYTGKEGVQFGWIGNKFVSSVEDYRHNKHLDGKSPFTWRSGMKHDCSKIMELEKDGANYTNGRGDTISLEPDLIHGLLKSSDLKSTTTTPCRKYTIVTQKKIGQSTDHIAGDYPLTYAYLNKHGAYFDQRKSSIYVGKPRFSIFGIGKYSFKDYKVAISGLYKSTSFTFLEPLQGKPLMLDDTCYFIGFDRRESAEIATYLLNSPPVQGFLQSIVFSDSKRSINKEILMRIDLNHAFENSDFNSAQTELAHLTYADWITFGKSIQEPVSLQATLF